VAEERNDTVKREAALLGGLCHCNARERSELLQKLARYRWQGADHQWIFEALVELGGSEPAGLEEKLAQQLVRKGFPDINLESIFAPPAASWRTAQELAGELLSRERSGQ